MPSGDEEPVSQASGVSRRWFGCQDGHIAEAVDNPAVPRRRGHPSIVSVQGLGLLLASDKYAFEAIEWVWGMVHLIEGKLPRRNNEVNVPPATTLESVRELRDGFAIEAVGVLD
jgi:hypothetical protein